VSITGQMVDFPLAAAIFGTLALISAGAAFMVLTVVRTLRLCRAPSPARERVTW
jgi:hypothetical protein